MAFAVGVTFGALAAAEDRIDTFARARLATVMSREIEQLCRIVGMIRRRLGRHSRIKYVVMAAGMTGRAFGELRWFTATTARTAAGPGRGWAADATAFVQRLELAPHHVGVACCRQSVVAQGDDQAILAMVKPTLFQIAHAAA